MGIGETFCRALAKLVMRAAGDQAIAACGKLQMCAVLKADIEGSTHAVWQHRIDRVRAIRGKEVAESGSFNEEEERGGMTGRLNNLAIETVETEDEAAEILKAMLYMEIVEVGKRE